MIKRARAFFFAVILGALPVSGIAETASACAQLSVMLEQLAQKYHEAPLFYGRGADGADIIITADPSGKTWTALVGDASGNVCIAAIGPNWRSIIADVSFDQEG